MPFVCVSEMAYNIGMNKELESRLNEIKTQISNLQMLGECDDCIHVLNEQKEWLEGMIANFAE